MNKEKIEWGPSPLQKVINWSSIIGPITLHSVSGPTLAGILQSSTLSAFILQAGILGPLSYPSSDPSNSGPYYPRRL